MKVLHVSGANSWGGNEQQLFNLVTHLNQVDNAIFGTKNSPVEKHASKNQIPFFASKTPKLKSVKNISRFFEVIQQFNPEVIHLHTSCSLTLCFYASLCKSIKAKVVFEKKGISNSSSYLSRLKYNSSSINHIVCVSNYVKQHFKSMLTKKNQQKLSVVNDSFNLDFKEVDYDSMVDSSKFVVGNIANHSAAKDLDRFIDVADQLVNHHQIKDIQFVQVGGFSKLTPEYKSRLKELNLEEHVLFIGQFNQAYLLHDYFDVFLLTSEREGGPTSLLEAFYFKTKVVVHVLVFLKH
ncbi:Glycosyltransferase involved in cell wall bisynthesis [Psychroflexus salarius]|uniref:Glycosyltransferase involved in cell wall bisynthesis n=1 Tax=Psychroflexus salarius TaxID=1155689 RepID=A0A1M4Y087_9FLAO|nr:glycosyltransferase [Psychroflexus salarius]SHE98902.1 Glycosyltransferase involved in cell wall bisynthesis [Psychroflexus salarius]